MLQEHFRYIHNVHLFDLVEPLPPVPPVPKLDIEPMENDLDPQTSTVLPATGSGVKPPSQPGLQPSEDLKYMINTNLIKLDDEVIGKVSMVFSSFLGILF